jgi:hypothetical protein
MPYATYLHNLGALITFGLGLMAIIRPSSAAALTGLTPTDPLGMSETRATFGGFFLALGALALLSQHPWTFIVVGTGWGGAAVGRLISVFVDKSRSPKNLGAVAFEAGVATLLLIPAAAAPAAN